MSSEAPKNAATQPTRRQGDRRQVPRRVGVGGRRVLERQHGQHQGRDRDPGDDPEQRPPRVCLRLQSPDERAERDGAEDAHVHDHRRVAQLVGRIADRKRRHRSDQQEAGAQPLDHATRGVHAGILCRGREDRADHEQHRVAEQHPALREVLGELDGQHRAHRVGGVCQAGAQTERLHAHVQLLADDRCQWAEAPRRARGTGSARASPCAATAGYRPASGPWRSARPRRATARPARASSMLGRCAPSTPLTTDASAASRDVG